MLSAKNVFLTQKRSLLSICIAFIFINGFLYDVVNYVQLLINYIPGVNKSIYFLIFCLPQLLLLILACEPKSLCLLNKQRIILASFFVLTISMSTITNCYILTRSSLVFMPLMIVLWGVILPGCNISRSDIIFILKILIALAMVYCLTNLCINYRILFSFWSSPNPYANNCQGIYFNKNSWGQLMFAFVFGNALLISLEPSKKKWFITLAIIAYNLLASLSRTAILSAVGFSVALAILYYLKNKQYNWRKIIIAVLGIIILVVILAFIPQLHNLWSNYFFRSTNVLTFRDKLWLIAWKSLPNLPLWGYGIGSQLQLIRTHGVYVASFHNMYIDWLMQGGIICLASFLFMIWQSMKDSYEVYKQETAVGAVILASIVAFLIYISADIINLFYFSTNDLMFCFFILTLPAVMRRNCTKTNSPW